MSEPTKLVALPAYLPRRLQAFRIVRGDQTSYVLRDKLADRTYDLEQWQFFVLEVLPGCDTAAKLLSVFSDRFGREITEREVMGFFAELADKKLLDDESAKHPLLKPFTKTGYALEQGLIKPKSFEELAAKMALQGTAGAPAAAKADAPKADAPPAAPPAPPADDADQPAGVAEADGLDPRNSKLLVKFFPLRPVVAVLLPIVEPLKYGVYLLPLVALAAIMLLIRHSGLVWEDLQTLREATVLVEHALFSLLTINLSVTLTQALVAQKFRASVGDLGIGLRFGFFPRFMAPIGHTKQLSRRERMWLQAGPLLMRVTLFSIGVLTWYNARDSLPFLSRAGIGLAFICSVNLIVEGGNPLVKGNSYHLLAAFMNEPYLRGKAYKAFMDRITGGATTESGQNLLATYALASFVYAYVVVLLIVAIVGNFLIYEMRLGGASLIVVAALGIYLTMRTVRRAQMISRAYERSVQFERWRRRALPAEGGETVQKEPEGSRTWYYLSRAALLTLFLLLFLPYSYDAGGSFEIFPADRQVITSDIGGVIEEVNFDGGESVRKGTVLARLAATDLTAQMAVFDAKMAEQKATIAELKARPKKEEIAVAVRELEMAQKRAQFSGEKVPRLKRLYDDRTISFEEYETARREHEVDLREVATRQAQVALVKTGTPPDRIAAEEAKLVALGQQRAELEGKAVRTVLHMPFDGNILTLHLKQRLNSVLDKGAPFATVESTGQVTAEIDVPESDIGYVKVGSLVRAKPNAFHEKTYEGRIKTIDRNVSQKSFGRVVKVIAVVDNPQGELKTGMTGYAKVAAGTIPVWKAFSLALVRFVEVQVWSWIP
ncbi:MAG: efflux RND transporter periplasmic adaptor subunit [Rubrivivax sp.]